VNRAGAESIGFTPGTKKQKPSGMNPEGSIAEAGSFSRRL
jgi:hypothetical protein